MIGQTLSHYRITSSLGAGGMGVVYRATDANLGRDVAIKVLPPEVKNDAERLARFRREARVLASLSHPNIASIYGLEEADGTPFLSLELVEGEDLSTRLARGPIPVDEAIEIAEQIAEALEEAHGKGVVHRDLKPGNVKLTAEGKVKVLDFGLAKALDQAAGGGPQASGHDLANSPTMTSPALTRMGMILGTAAYMSPEQARGKPVDRRADVWAFGVILWEMLTGRTLFPGETVTDVIASVVTSSPDLSALPPETPLAVRRLLERCLRKDPRQRLPDIGAARLELQDVRAGVDGGDGLSVPASPGKADDVRTRPSWARVAVAAGLVIVAIAMLPLLWRGEDVPDQLLPARFALDLPEGWRLHEWGWPAVSPDGSQVVFRAVPEGNLNGDAWAMLWVRSLAAVGSRALPGTEGAYVPFWSPDGRSVGFFANQGLHRLDLASGVVQRVSDVTGTAVGGADWGSDGRILFSAGPVEPTELYLAPESGGEARVLATGNGIYVAPQLLTGERFFVLRPTGVETPGVYLSLLDAADDWQLVLEGVRRAQYAGGYLFYAQGAALMAQPFDMDEGAPSGEPTVVSDALAIWGENPGIGWFGVSEGGTLAYETGQSQSGDVQLTWMNRDGQPVGTLGSPGDYGQVALSPDERNLAVEVVDETGGYDIWVMDVARGVASRVTTGPDDERNPVWSPDGRSISFSAGVPEATDIRRKGLRASDPETVIVDTDQADLPEAWVRGGRDLLFVRGRLAENGWTQGIWIVSPGEDREPQSFMDTGFFFDETQVSPDGEWLAYTSRESGQSEVYIEPFDRAGERVRVSVDGGGQPKWRGDGQELFFVDPQGQLMSVAVTPGQDRADVDLPVELFPIADVEGAEYDDYAPASDGSRFLVKVPIDAERPLQMHVVTNWRSLID